MNITEEIFQIRSCCIESLVNDNKLTQLISMCSAVNKELQGIHTWGSSSFKRYEWVKYVWPILRRL